MAEKGTAGRVGVQDTGNPVLDSTVNIISAIAMGGHLGAVTLIEQVHTQMMDLAKKEPGGLRCPTSLQQVSALEGRK